MISEQEAKEAVKMFQTAVDYFRRFEHDGSEEAENVNKAGKVAASVMATWITEEFDRREKDASFFCVEIDGQFLEGIGFDNDNGSYTKIVGSNVVEWHVFWFVNVDGVLFEQVTTRGQLLDLIAALKGEPA